MRLMEFFTKNQSDIRNPLCYLLITRLAANAAEHKRGTFLIMLNTKQKRL